MLKGGSANTKSTEPSRTLASDLRQSPTSKRFHSMRAFYGGAAKPQVYGTGILACDVDAHRQECLGHRSAQLADRFTVLDDRLKIARQIGAKPKLRHIEQEVDDGGEQVRRSIRLHRGAMPLGIGTADDLAHFQAAAGDRQGRQVAPVVAAALAISLRAAAHFARHD